MSVVTESERLIQQLPVVKHRARKVTLLNKLSRTIYRNEPERSLGFSTQSLMLAKKLRNTVLEAECLVEMASAYHVLSNYSTSIDCLMRALNIFGRTRSEKEKATASHKLAGVLIETGEISKGILYAEEALAIRQHNYDTEGMIDTHIVLGGLKKCAGQFDASLEHVYEARHLAKTYGFILKESVSLNDIGILYVDLGNADKGRNFVSQAAEKAQQSNDLPSRASAIHKLGEIALSHNEQAKAHAYFLEANDLYDIIGDQKGRLTIRVSLGQFYLAASKYNEAFRFAEEGYELARQLGHYELTIQSSVLVASILQKLNQPHQALVILFSALPKAEKPLSASSIKIYQSIAAAYELCGEIENAFIYQKHYSEALERIYKLHLFSIHQQLEQLICFEEALLEKQRNSAFSHLLPKLTFAELKVASLLEQGVDSKGIAEKLCISLRTVENHRQHIRRKLGLSNGENLISYLKSFN